LIDLPLQQNILTLAVYDKKAVPLLIANLDTNLFSMSHYREILKASFDYFVEYKEPVGEHLADIIDHHLNNEDKNHVALYKEVIYDLHQNKTEVNRAYVLSKLNNFIKKKQIIKAAYDAVEFVKEDKVEEAELALRGTDSSTLTLFDEGTRIGDIDKMLSYFTEPVELIPTGIKALDEVRACPAKGKLFSLLARSGTGKSWFLTQIGKHAQLLHKNVLHVSLEMSEKQVTGRYMQAFFAVNKHKGEKLVKTQIFEDGGGYVGFEQVEVTPDFSFDSAGAQRKLKKNLEKLKGNHLVVKGFPTSYLTVTQLRAYLENLRNFENFVPEIIMIDYPGIMKLDTRDTRISLSQTYKQLRGIGAEYDAAMVVVSQVNGDLENVKWLREKDSAETKDIYKDSDIFATLNMTEREQELGLARIQVKKNRDETAGWKILITQNYATGQFCLQSTRFNESYLNDFLK